jgi:hypothetical protein
MEDEMTRTTKAASSKTKASQPEREGNRYIRAARVLAKDDRIGVKTLADRAFMSESTAARCVEAWQACVAALIEVGRLPDLEKKVPMAKKSPAQKKAPKVATETKPPAATETTATPVETVETTAST